MKKNLLATLAALMLTAAAACAATVPSNAPARQKTWTVKRSDRMA